ncbi:hypothetical protein CAOG_00319 [Capsaspora owczarzaki ATCC 30864]|uniref:Uncharacterized protein n=1 Tax=Capsaspora owczarzaki (strain ATCC 30864) TaxID=595528 RepID=A0A0D2X0A6_CAPO3|nr:hypothetical protein CAOG_00319 [Capsaspora owczarzaki ATCC 30864]KJE88724.1 hypothetical protein CAOG_000319 [Capsaspora owczarzaki ATCC 30864]|eukprot:XP_004365190.2 hypothetical protein CAOG_00319 [Capsaspora owczarzaki ATCC 30864]
MASPAAEPTPEPLFILRGLNGAVNALCFHARTDLGESGDPDWLIAGGRCGRCWTRTTPKGIAGVAALASANQIATQGRDGFLRLWDMGRPASSRADAVCSIPVDTVTFCKLSVLDAGLGQAGGPLAAVPSLDMTRTQVMDLTTQQVICSVPFDRDAKHGTCTSVKLYRDAATQDVRLLAGYEGGEVVLYSITAGKVISKIHRHQEGVLSVQASLDEPRIGFSCGIDDVVSSFSLETNQPLQVANEVRLPQHGCNELAIRPDGKLVATGGWDSKVRVFSARSLKQLAVLRLHTDSVHAVAFSHPLRRSKERGHMLLATGSKDERIGLWSLYPPPTASSRASVSS